MKNYFKVYRNGAYIGQTQRANLKEAKRSVHTGFLIGEEPGFIHIGTHMGEWRRKINGYYYHTTVGVTLDFVRFAR